MSYKPRMMSNAVWLISTKQIHSSVTKMGNSCIKLLSSFRNFLCDDSLSAKRPHLTKETVQCAQAWHRLRFSDLLFPCLFVQSHTFVFVPASLFFVKLCCAFVSLILFAFPLLSLISSRLFHLLSFCLWFVLRLLQFTLMFSSLIVFHHACIFVLLRSVYPCLRSPCVLFSFYVICVLQYLLI